MAVVVKESAPEHDVWWLESNSDSGAACPLYRQKGKRRDPAVQNNMGVVEYWDKSYEF